MRFKNFSITSAIAKYRIQRKRKTLEKSFQQAKSMNVVKQLLLDVSVLAMHDAGTGIQRVSRSILHEFLSNPPNGYRVCPIGATRKKGYRYIEWDLKDNNHKKGDFVKVNAGDLFLGLDLSTTQFFSHKKTLFEWKSRGVSFHIIIYDLLPLIYPKWFSDVSARSFEKWIKIVATIANQLLCISEQTRNDVSLWFKQNYAIAENDLPKQVIPMGADFSKVLSSRGYPENFDDLLILVKKYPSALMVGTIEPRKGHEDILDAFDILWQQGEKLNLIIVGRPGWKTDLLQKRMREHKYLGRYLFWFENASDEALEKLYETCNGLIIASFAEGFGLPLIEAIGRSKRILARNLPIFLEQKFEAITFFDNNAEKDLLAVAIINWMKKLDNENKFFTENAFTWCQSVIKIQKILNETLKSTNK